MIRPNEKAIQYKWQGNKIYAGDCLDVLRSLPNNSIDLVLTSPPYADRRKNVYGGVNEGDYVSWFLPLAKEIKRVLKPTGSFFLNIKPHARKGERSLYVFDLVLALKRTEGWFFVDEFCWVKNGFPGKLVGRFKNGFEPVYHFTKGSPSNITFYPLACGTPVLEASVKRASRKQCDLPKNESGMAGNRSKLGLVKPVARPSNVIQIHNVVNQYTGNDWHPATFPVKLAEFFIRSFSNEGDLVLDPFSGSGTTGVASLKLKRKFILIDKKLTYVSAALARLKQQ